MTRPRILGLTGRAGAGKSTIAGELVQMFNFIPVSFASFFKTPLWVATPGLDIGEVYGTRPKSPETRALLQHQGTERGRDLHGPNVWLLHMEAELYRLGSYGVRYVVCDDVRFPNEADYILRNGGKLYRLVREEAEPLPGDAALHSSETAINTLKAAAVNNSNERPPIEVARMIAEDFFGAIFRPTLVPTYDVDDNATQQTETTTDE